MQMKIAPARVSDNSLLFPSFLESVEALWVALTEGTLLGRIGTSIEVLLLGYSIAVFLALLCWLVIETQDGSYLGVAERLTSSVQTTWPFVVAVVLWHHAARTRRPELPGAPPETLHEQALTTGALRGQRDLA